MADRASSSRRSDLAARLTLAGDVVRRVRRASLCLLAVSAVAAPTPAAARNEGFTPIGSYGAYRIDGVRDGTHEGAPVRFVDMTLRNASGQTTFPETIQAVWWQGRDTGRQVDARRRDLSRFGMYDFVTPGQVVPVTYVIPARSDIDGIRVDYMHAEDGPKERRWTWEQLLARAPGTPYSRGRPIGPAPDAAPTAQETPTAPARPAQREPTPSARGRPDLAPMKEAVPTLRTLLERRGKRLPF